MRQANKQNKTKEITMQKHIKLFAESGKNEILEFNQVRHTSAKTGSLSVITESGTRIVAEILRSYSTNAAVVLWISDQAGECDTERHIFRIDSSTTTNRQIGEFLEFAQSRPTTRKLKSAQHRSAVAIARIVSDLCNGAIFLSENAEEQTIVEKLLLAYQVKMDEKAIYNACKAPTAQARCATI